MMASIQLSEPSLFPKSSEDESDSRKSILEHSSTSFQTRASFPGCFGRDEFTLNKLRFSSIGLYGRDKELAKLHNSFDRVCSNESAGRELVLLSGHSGTGKTTLAQELQKPVKKSGGFFAFGKFDFQRRAEPYTAFSMAFNRLCDSVISLKTEANIKKFESIRSCICDAVGCEAQALTSIVPNLNLILQNEDKDSNSRNSSNVKLMRGPRSKNKFNFLMRQFVRAICRPSQPLVLMIDDLQWADEASLGLMETLMTDEENSGLLFLGCYRDNEVDTKDHHPLTTRIQNIERHGESSTIITKIPVGNLSVETTNDLLEDLLTSNKKKTENLAQIVHKKTQGNIFFVIEFLKSLKDRGMLTYNMGLMRWELDEEEIRSKMNVTENVAELMRDKMEQVLNDEAKRILLIAACLGFTFEASTLILVVLKMKEEKEGEIIGKEEEEEVELNVLRSLNLCVEENLLEKEKNRIGSDSSETTYWFVHDQIQQAALNQVSNDEQATLQFRIGEILVDHLTGETLEKNLFVAVNLLNRGVGHANTNGRFTIKLANLNLRAGKKAIEGSAFIPGAAYLRMGIEILGSECWGKESHILCIELHSVAAQAEYCSGNFSEMHKYLEKVLTRDEVPFSKKLPLYLTLLDALRAQERHLETIETSIFVLSKLGIIFPRKNLKLQIVKQLVKTKMLLRGKSMDSLLSLPVVEDEDKIILMKIMNALSISAYLVEPDLLPLVVFKMVQWSIRFGASYCAPLAFNSYGIIMCALGDMKTGYEFGKLATSLLERVDAKDLQAQVIFIYHTFISHWFVPISSSVRPLLDGYQVGMKTGDIENAMYNLLGYMWCSLNRGRELSLLEKDMRNYILEMKRYKQDTARMCCLVPWQLVLNLLGKADDPLVLTGEAMEHDDMMKHFKEINNMQLIDLVKVIEMMLAFYFGEYERAWELVESSTFETTQASSPVLWRKLMFEGLTAFSLAQKKNVRKFKARGVKILRRLKKWVAMGNMNCIHVVHLLQAEEAALNGKLDQACKHYHESIKVASRAGFVHDKALANERAGEFFLANNDNRNQASFHFDIAHQLYVEWGARAKSDQFFEAHAALLSDDVSFLPESRRTRRSSRF